MMKKLLILLSALTISFFSQSQWTILPDGPYKDDHHYDVKFDEMNNGDLLMLFKTINDSLKMNKYDNSTWSDVVPGVLDSDVNYINMIHNPFSDTLFIGYTKSDGFYYRMYSSAGWTPEIHHAGYTNAVQVTLDKDNNVPYFLVHSTNGESELISYSLNGDSLIVQSGPNDVSYDNINTQLLFNEADNYLYVAYVRDDLKPTIRRYNNTVWAIVDDQISPHTNSHLGPNFFHYNPISDSLEYRFVYLSNGNFYYGYNTYNYSNNGKTEVVGITLIENQNFSGYGDSYNDEIFFWDCEPNFLLCGDDFSSAPGDYPQNTTYKRFHTFVSNGSLIFVEQITRDIYKREPFVLGEFEHELQAFPIVYPNPTKNSLQLDVTEEHELSIYNLSGELVVAPQPYQPNQELSIQFLPSGLYILKLKNQSGIIHHQRFVVE